MQYTHFTKNEFQQKHGYSLDKVVPDDHDPGSKVTRFISRVCERIITHVEKQMSGSRFDREELTEKQVQILNQAAMEEAVSVIENGDISRLSGFDAISGQMISQDELIARRICREAKEILEAKIIYRGI